MAINFTDHGGTLIQFVRVYLIFWGSAWARNPPPTPTAAQVTDAVNRIVSGGYLTGLSQYRGVGQGYILAAPLQLCVLASRIASGMHVMPRVVHSLGAQPLPRPAVEPIGFAPDALNVIRDAMSSVTNEPGGTAYPWRITDPMLAMAGKTGTAQVRVISNEERQHGVRSNENLPWNLRDHGLFIGFAPVDKPRYAIAVVIEHGGLNSHPQVQLERDALTLAQTRDVLGRPTAYPLQAAAL